MELGFFSGEVSLLPKEINFSPSNNHVPREKEFKLPQ
jgi:hypothetical protein